MGWEGRPRRMVAWPTDLTGGWKRLNFLSAWPVLETGGSVVVWALLQALEAS